MIHVNELVIRTEGPIEVEEFCDKYFLPKMLEAADKGKYGAVIDFFWGDDIYNFKLKDIVLYMNIHGYYVNIIRKFDPIIKNCWSIKIHWDIKANRARISSIDENIPPQQDPYEVLAKRLNLEGEN